jgi:hypothetical protein
MCLDQGEPVMIQCIAAAGMFWLYGISAGGGAFLINVNEIEKIYVGRSAMTIIETEISTTELPAQRIQVNDVLKVLEQCEEKVTF